MNTVLASLNAKYIHTNLAIRYLKAAAAEYQIELAEYTINDPILNITGDLYAKKPDVIGFSCYIWNIEETIQVAKMLKKILPEIKIIFGGPEVTYDVPYWLKRLEHDADYIVVGEGEASFKELLDYLSGKINYDQVRGVASLIDGRMHLTPQPQKTDLKTLPSPFRFAEDQADLRKRITYVETSRGCPFQCQFCLSSIEVGVRYFEREAVKEDIRYLMKHGARIIKFVDRTFNISRSYAMEMFEFLIDEHLPGTVFQFEITGDIMRPEVIQYLNDHAPEGLFRFEIGVQSTNDHTNELVKRKQNFEKLKRTVTMVKDGGKIDQHLDLIAGLPEENYQSFKQTFNDVYELGPEELQLGFLKMLRGTGLRINAADHQYVYMDHAPYEILSNNQLTFDDILRIKHVEDVLEKYWNDHRLDDTIHYLTTEVFETPFDFFQDFGTYWDQKGWSRIGHQLEDLFKRLYQFIEESKHETLPYTTYLMKKDYLQKHKFKPRKPWWDKEDINFSNLYDLLLSNPEIAGEHFASLNLKQKELHKHTVLVEGLKSIEGKPVQVYLLAYYDPKTGSPSLFEFTKEQTATSTTF
ncbi:B12-binding domain-containing radical SAM protein [Jeotgalibacillus salarius]|uniref:B12-binding domain-containing radical SAM protein n=1 Tax=Jeotgalibacillus salarius TaxID=546023 RepID=A0A4Y8LCF3_9BACL|nr:radical SAM protein [Jeotgalibacillus salarius]TFE00346.1 B12-binding domain-containing radical SAM protein [Jeotgalibacillus salarius]